MCKSRTKSVQRQPHANPTVEYQQSLSEYNEALAELQQWKANQRIDSVNQSLGTYSGSQADNLVGAGLSAFNDIGELDAQRKAELAWQRLQNAQQRLRSSEMNPHHQHIYVHPQAPR